MNKKLNRVLAGTLWAFLPTAVYAEVYQCDVDGKSVFQQTPCPIVAVATTGCDEYHDYSVNVDDAKATFDDRYCYYLQLDKVEETEKQRLLQAYKERRAEIAELAQREAAYDKLQKIAEESGSYTQDSDSYAKESSSYINGASSYGKVIFEE